MRRLNFRGIALLGIVTAGLVTGLALGVQQVADSAGKKAGQQAVATSQATLRAEFLKRDEANRQALIKACGRTVEFKRYFLDFLGIATKARGAAPGKINQEASAGYARDYSGVRGTLPPGASIKLGDRTNGCQSQYPPLTAKPKSTAAR